MKGEIQVVQQLNDFLDENLNHLKENGLYNEIDTVEGANGPEIQINGKKYINLSSNNYLGLATNEDLKTVAKNAIDSHGVGAWCGTFNQRDIRLT